MEEQNRQNIEVMILAISAVSWIGGFIIGVVGLACFSLWYVGYGFH